MATVWVKTHYGLVPFDASIQPWTESKTMSLVVRGLWRTRWGADPPKKPHTELWQIQQASMLDRSLNLGSIVACMEQLSDYVDAYPPAVVYETYTSTTSLTDYIMVFLWEQQPDRTWKLVMRRQIPRDDYAAMVRSVDETIGGPNELHHPIIGLMALDRDIILTLDRQSLHTAMEAYGRHGILPTHLREEGVLTLPDRLGLYPEPIESALLDIYASIARVEEPPFEDNTRVAPTADAPKEPTVDESAE